MATVDTATIGDKGNARIRHNTGEPNDGTHPLYVSQATGVVQNTQSRGGLTYASGAIARPSNTTAYTANDVIGVTGGGTAALSIALGAVSGSSIMIRSVAFQRDVNALAASE